jgi:hypothetical protein
MLSAAAQKSGSTARKSRFEDGIDEWVRGQKEETKNSWLSRVIADPRAARAAILAEFKKGNPKQTWPTTASRRTISELRELADEIEA